MIGASGWLLKRKNRIKRYSSTDTTVTFEVNETFKITDCTDAHYKLYNNVIPRKFFGRLYSRGCEMSSVFFLSIIVKESIITMNMNARTLREVGMQERK
jgi:hypothetical protein